MFVDVHTHLTHGQFENDWTDVIQQAEKAGLKAIVVNGLEPDSNRQILAMSKQFPIVKAAMGIYPINAAFDKLTKALPYTVTPFDREKEVAYIDTMAASGQLIAIGECGLDLYWLEDSSLPQQEKVWIQLLEVGMKHDLPVIIHSRKAEQRCAEILAHHGVKKVDFHCYGGKVNPALRWAEQYGWYFSIPANCRSSESFTALLKKLPLELILTETDAPYLSPERGTRNEPKNVVGTVHYLAELRDISKKEAELLVWNNYCRLFGTAL